MRQLNLLNSSTASGSPSKSSERGIARKTVRRRGSFARWRRRAPRLALIGLMVSASLTVGIWMMQPGSASWVGNNFRSAFLSVTADLGMTVQWVYTEGRHQTAPEAILLALEARMGTPIFAVDPRQARARLQKLSWVEKATVERRLPSTLVVHLVEREPFALWQRNKELVVIDRAGTVISADAVRRFTHLPRVVGPDAPFHAPELLDAMATDPILSKRVQAAIRIGDRRWNLRFDTGLEARLPEGEIGPAWERLVSEIGTRDLLSEPFAVVDLRFDDRTILRRRPSSTKAGDETL